MQVDKRSTAKWGEAGKGGFQIVPDILLKKQVELGLSPTDLAVLINLTMHWWYAHQRPFPRTTTIAARMGVDDRTVQRSLKKLTTLQLMERVKEPLPDGSERQVCDLSGLIARLDRYVREDPDYQARIARNGSDPEPIETITL